MTHPEIATRVRALIRDERFDEAEMLLPDYARAVIDECVTAADEASFASARAFLRATIIDLRARRIHIAQRLREAARARQYLPDAPSQGDLDVTG
jgi:hypothetical protein